jgi:DNA-binding beta-propeller fold protein YncE
MDPSGHIYVADTENHRVVKLGPTLEVALAWGSFGRGDGEFQLPQGVAVDRSGRVYVADWGNRRIQTFTSEGRFLDKWGELRSNELGGLFTPTHVALTDAGEVVVYAGRVHRFSSSGRRLGVWGRSSQLGSRGGIGLDGTGNVYGVTGDSRPDQPLLRRWNAEGEEVAAWGTRGVEAGQVFDPIAFGVDRRGRVYVADWGGPRVIVFDARGAFVHQYDARGGDAPGLRYPSGLAIDPRGRVYVVDRASPRIHVLGPLPGG